MPREWLYLLGLSAEVRGTNQSVRNALDAQALIDTAEGAHKEVENILQRMRELAIQAANGTNNADDITNLEAEFTALSTEIDKNRRKSHRLLGKL